MSTEEDQARSSIQEQIDKSTGVTKTLEQIANTEGYILEEAVQAKDQDGNIVTLPAGSRIRKM